MSGTRGLKPSRFPFRPSRPVVTVGVVAALAAGFLSIEAAGTANAQTLDTVTLKVDGVATSVTTGASTVGSLLNQESITVDSTDKVSPGTSSSVSNGMTVTVDHEALITVVDNDTSTQSLVTADTVAATTEELSLPEPQFSSLSSTKYDGYSYRRTLFFDASGARLARKDPISDGATAVVQDVRIGFPQKKVTVDHKTVRQSTKLLYSGTKRVVKDGRDGTRQLTYRRMFVDGQLTRQSVVDRTWLKEPRRRVVRVGDGPNWPALARCESGGNPNAVNPAGYYGLYQFSLSTWRGVGGTGSPTDFGYWEQTLRAWKLFQKAGRSPWPLCGAYL